MNVTDLSSSSFISPTVVDLFIKVNQLMCLKFIQKRFLFCGERNSKFMGHSSGSIWKLTQILENLWSNYLMVKQQKKDWRDNDLFWSHLPASSLHKYDELHTVSVVSPYKQTDTQCWSFIYSSDQLLSSWDTFLVHMLFSQIKSPTLMNY